MAGDKPKKIPTSPPNPSAMATGTPSSNASRKLPIISRSGLMDDLRIFLAAQAVKEILSHPDNDRDRQQRQPDHIDPAWQAQPWGQRLPVVFLHRKNTSIPRSYAKNRHAHQPLQNKQSLQGTRRHVMLNQFNADVLIMASGYRCTGA